MPRRRFTTLRGFLFMKEIWKDVNGFAGYQVSTLGRIRVVGITIPRGKHLVTYREHVLKNFISRNGYVRVDFKRNGQKKRESVHRVVAMAFIPNPNGLPMVNHKNAIRHDNRLENLEWVSASYNQRHRLFLNNPSWDMEPHHTELTG